MKKAIFFLFFISLLSCTNNDKFKQYNSLLTTLESANKNIEDYKAIFLIPGQGCGHCVEDAEEFLMTYAESKKSGVLFVLTGRDSEKPLLLKFGPKLLRSRDVYVDYKNIFDVPPFKLQFPQLFNLDEGKIVDIEEVNPSTSNNVYEKLNKALNN